MSGGYWPLHDTPGTINEELLDRLVIPKPGDDTVAKEQDMMAAKWAASQNSRNDIGTAEVDPDLTEAEG